MLIRCEENADRSMTALSLHVINDRSSGDVVVRIRTNEGRDEWIYCHSNVLVSKSKYFSDRLSDDWPTCQILDSRNCIEVYCEESNFDYYMSLLRILYALKDGSLDNICNGVRNALGILRVAVELGCPEIIASCVEYIEAVPWEETEEEEILRIVPSMGSNVEKILDRLQPVNHSTISKIFISATRFATSSPDLSMNSLKNSVQEQLEYMLTDDDDAPLLFADEAIKTEVLKGVDRLFTTLRNLVESLLSDTEDSSREEVNFQTLLSVTSDMCWAWQILAKLEIVRDFVQKWLEISEKVVKVVDQVKTKSEMIETKLKVLEVTAKVLEAVGYGTVILPACKRLYLVKIWLPFVQAIKLLFDTTSSTDDENDPTLKFDGELWQSMESTFVSLILTLPSGDLAEILTEWLANQHIQYPDLTEAFEVWCYRSKVAKPRLACIVGEKGLVNEL